MERMKKNIQNTFLSNNSVLHSDGHKYLVLESCNHSNEMLVLRLATSQAYHYYNGVLTPVDLDTARTDGCYFANGVIHNWIAGKIPEKTT